MGNSMSAMRLVLLGLSAFVAAGAALNGPVMAAAGTTCLCRSADGKSFTEKTHRHHRWACDYKLGYVKKDEDADADETKPVRPDTETCNQEEIIQYKVWACMQRGCTYQYSKRIETKNPALEIIEPMEGKRRP
jgi:hypothetical protein